MGDKKRGVEIAIKEIDEKIKELNYIGEDLKPHPTGCYVSNRYRYRSFEE